jgi:hypothetical protein
MAHSKVKDSPTHNTDATKQEVELTDVEVAIVPNGDHSWVDDPSILIHRSRFIEFFPAKAMSHAEKLNALVRFSFYTSILIYLYQQVAIIFVLPVMAMFITYYIHSVKKQSGQSPLDDIGTGEGGLTTAVVRRGKRKCVNPTPNNPFMNVMITDYREDPDRPEACDIEEKAVVDQANKYWWKKQYTDVDKVFRRNTQDRQWVTNPSTTIPNDRDTFSRWVYGGTPSCKTDVTNCEPAFMYQGGAQKSTL